MVAKRMKREGTCSVEEHGKICGDKIIAKGYCLKHYARWQKHGDPLVVKKAKPRGKTEPKPPRNRWFTCVACGVEFERHLGSGRPPTVCSEECKAERQRKQAANWYIDNPEAAKVYRASDRNKAALRKWYEENKEREIQRSLKYARDHPEKKQARDAKYYALTRGAPEAELFSLNEIFERDEHICHLCGGEVNRSEATMDHVIPVSKGGPHTHANVKLAHWSCNSRKSDSLL